jgi:hypothetical protein
MENKKCCSHLQEYYEHLRIVREILIKEQQQRSVQTKPGRAEQSMSDKT